MTERSIAKRGGRRHIRRMADDLKTFREVGQAIAGLRREFGYFKWVMGGMAALMVAGFWHLSGQMSDLTKAVYRLDGRFEALEKRLAEAPKLAPSATPAPRTQGPSTSGTPRDSTTGGGAVPAIQPRNQAPTSGN